MSYNVFIVDDEPMIRYGIVSCIAWNKYGLNIVGEASNGQAALDKLAYQSVDILITDIKMPIMDGLTLISHLKKLNPHIQAILVSSYNDFEFAREAVKLGVVVDYLLKPTMEPEHLLSSVQQCMHHLDQFKEKELEREQYKESVQRTQTVRLQGELVSMLNNQRKGLSWIPEWFKLPLRLSIWKCKDQQLLGLIASAIETRFHLQVQVMMNDMMLVIVLSDEKGMSLVTMEQLYSELREQGYTRMTASISPSFQQLSSLHQIFSWTKQTLADVFYEGNGKLLIGSIPLQERFKIKSLQDQHKILQDQLKEQFSKALADGDQEQTKRCIEQMILLWEKKKFTMEEVRIQVENLLTIIWLKQYVLKSSTIMKDIVVRLQQMDQYEQLHELVKELRYEMSQYWSMQSYLLANDEIDHTHTMQLALTYIQEQYREDVSLQKVADYVHMSKNYFSEQFKKKTGMNYMDYVILLRIHYAKQLLSTTAIKVQEIGDRAGFNSPKHFLKLFKREVGCTPLEFRQQIKNQMGME